MKQAITIYVLTVWIASTITAFAAVLLTIFTGGEFTLDFNSFHKNWPEDALMSPQVAIQLPIAVALGLALVLTPVVYIWIRNKLL